MKKILMLLSLVCIVACGNKQAQTTKPVEPINRTIIGIALGDNRKVVTDTLKNQGYKWKDKGDSSFSWFEIDEGIQFSGYQFATVNIFFKDAKTDGFELMNEFDKKEEALKLYNEIKKKLDTKYLSYKDIIHKASCKTYSRYDDHKTNVILVLDYHPKENVDPIFSDNRDMVNMCKEYWFVDVSYNNTMYTSTRKKETNAF